MTPSVMLNKRHESPSTWFQCHGRYQKVKEDLTEFYYSAPKSIPKRCRVLRWRQKNVSTKTCVFCHLCGTDGIPVSIAFLKDDNDVLQHEQRQVYHPLDLCPCHTEQVIRGTVIVLQRARVLCLIFFPLFVTVIYHRSSSHRWMWLLRARQGLYATAEEY